MTPEEALEILLVLTAAYPNASIPEETVQVYIKFLADLPYKAGKAAALNLIAESRYFPTIAELRRAALASLPGADIPSPGEAWGEVVAKIREVGYYRQPTFSHPAIEKAVQAMGWKELCMSENPMADRAHFMRIYENYLERARREALQIPEAKQSAELAGGVEQKALPGPEAETNRAKVVSFISKIGRNLGG